MPGRLGHQVLGQVLLSGSSDVAIAAASVAVAAATRQRDVVTQVAISTVVPALAVRSLLQKQEDRIRKLADALAEHEQQLVTREEQLARCAAGVRQLDQVDAQATIRNLQAENRDLRARNAKLSASHHHSERPRHRRRRRRS